MSACNAQPSPPGCAASVHLGPAVLDRWVRLQPPCRFEHDGCVSQVASITSIGVNRAIGRIVVCGGGLLNAFYVHLAVYAKTSVYHTPARQMWICAMVPLQRRTWVQGLFYLAAALNTPVI